MLRFRYWSLNELALSIWLRDFVWEKVVVELNGESEWQLVLLQSGHGFWIYYVDGRGLLLVVEEGRYDEAVFFVVAFWVGNEAWLLSKCLAWTKGGNNFLLLVIILVDGPLVVLIVISLMHELE